VGKAERRQKKFWLHRNKYPDEETEKESVNVLLRPPEVLGTPKGLLITNAPKVELSGTPEETKAENALEWKSAGGEAMKKRNGGEEDLSEILGRREREQVRQKPIRAEKTQGKGFKLTRAKTHMKKGWVKRVAKRSKKKVERESILSSINSGSLGA